MIMCLTSYMWIVVYSVRVDKLNDVHERSAHMDTIFLSIMFKHAYVCTRFVII